MTRLVPEGVHAFLAIDPGGTTGVAAAHVEMKNSLKTTLLDGMRMQKSADVTGTWLEQAYRLMELVNRFRYTAQVEHGIPATHLHVAVEDYVLRLPADNTNLIPVWVAAGMTTLLPREAREELVWQQPSQAKRFATNDRLRLWGLWERGVSLHRMDAKRHLALLVNSVV